MPRKNRSHQAALIFGTQLFAHHPALSAANIPVIMIEAYSLCAKHRYHKHKLIFLLAAMREYRDRLEKSGHTVWYSELEPQSTFFDLLFTHLQREQITELLVVSPEDRSAREALRSFCQKHNIVLTQLESPAFLTPEHLGREWLHKTKKPLLESFYRWQRKRLNILVEKGQPTGGKWNFDTANRKPLPSRGLTLPALPIPKPSKHVSGVADQIESLFPLSPGEKEDFWLPVTHQAAQAWLQDFVQNRLPLFGTYEDAMAAQQPFLFHSVLSPLLNAGLLTPQEVVEAVLAAYQNGNAPINSVEGCLRQIIGWREYMRVVYWHQPHLKEANFFGFTKPLEPWWYTQQWQSQPLPLPVRSALQNVFTYGYTHHIERLMILGNWFLLNEYSPQSVYEWFLSLFVDAYEWVMVPNVQGMSQYADGGYVATKPYISGGNYLQKMGRWWDSEQASKESEFTKLYWQFLKKHQEKLRENPRMSLVLALAREKA